ncbi:MAG: hypothetical protein KQH83_10535 [Actinobacteria bacterium]|nr:hypothetical protein [Actinomycetota bacterium]
MNRPSFRQWIRYHFDNFMARGGRSIFVSLVAVFLAALALLVSIRLLLEAFVPEASDTGLGWSTFVTFLQLTDPGSMAEDSVSSGWYRVVAIAAGVTGIVLLAALIAFITNAVDRRLHDLRKGHSRVVERHHTLILGWEEQRVSEIVRELVIANESEDRQAIVILADRDKEYMDDFLAIAVPDRRTTRLVTRSGNPASPLNLRLAAVGAARSAIVLAGCADSAPQAAKAESDARVVKTLLALRSETGGGGLHAVVEVFDPAVRALLEGLTDFGVVALDARDFLSRILVQTSRSLGLSVVYDELLSFDGNEMYLCPGPFEGLRFGEVVFRYRQAIPIGVMDETGVLAVNPPQDRVLRASDRLLVVAEDDSTITFSDHPVAEPSRPARVTERLAREQERYLLVGRTPKSPLVLSELSKYVLPGSSVDVVPRMHPDGGAPAGIPAAGAGGLVVSTMDVDPLLPETWTSIEPSSYHAIVLLSEGDEHRLPDQIDAETILILLLIRRALEERGAPGTTVITELVESENQPLAASTGVNDFVISSRLVSMLLAQMSEEPSMHDVYEQLLQEEGSEIYLKPASLYLEELPAEVPFADLIGLAAGRGEVCIGVRTGRPGDPGGVLLAPPKTDLIAVGPGDSLVVLAEDET